MSKSTPDTMSDVCQVSDTVFQQDLVQIWIDHLVALETTSSNDPSLEKEQTKEQLVNTWKRQTSDWLRQYTSIKTEQQLEELVLQIQENARQQVPAIVQQQQHATTSSSKKTTTNTTSKPATSFSLLFSSLPPPSFFVWSEEKETKSPEELCRALLEVQVLQDLEADWDEIIVFLQQQQPIHHDMVLDICTTWFGKWSSDVPHENDKRLDLCHIVWMMVMAGDDDNEEAEKDKNPLALKVWWHMWMDLHLPASQLVVTSEQVSHWNQTTWKMVQQLWNHASDHVVSDLLALDPACSWFGVWRASSMDATIHAPVLLQGVPEHVSSPSPQAQMRWRCWMQWLVVGRAGAFPWDHAALAPLEFWQRLDGSPVDDEPVQVSQLRQQAMETLRPYIQYHHPEAFAEMARQHT